MVDRTENYLNISEPYEYDNSVQKINYISQDPPTGTNLNGSSMITLTINPTDNLLLPSRSYLYIEGRLIKASDGTRYTKNAVGLYPDIALSNNFFPYLFNSIKYSLNDTELESFNYPGQCTTLKHLLTKSKSFEGLGMGWAIDTYDGMPRYNEYTYYPMKTFVSSDFPAANPAVPTKAELKVFALKFVVEFKLVNNDQTINQFSDPDYDAAVPGDPLTVNMIVALGNLIINQINDADAPEAPAITAADVPGVTRDNIVAALNACVRNINNSIPPRDTYGIKQNLGFIKRKDLLFNPQSNVTPDTSAGSFSFMIPLSYLFNFCENYQKVLYNCKHELQLNRDNSDSYAIIKDYFVTDSGKISIDLMRWYMPTIIPNEANKLMLYQTIKSKIEVDLAFMNKKIDIFNDLNDKTTYSATLNYSGGIEKPRYIVAAFQTVDKTKDGSNDLQNINHSIFNGTNLSGSNFAMVDVRYVNVYINGDSYQLMDYNNNFNDNRFSRWYNEYRKFRMSYMNDFEDDDIISLDSFRNLYRLYVFDISKQSETITNGVANVRLEFNFNSATPSSTNCDIKLFCLSFYDRIWRLGSDGTKQYIIK